MPILRGMSVCYPSLSTFPSTDKVQQSNSKLLCAAKQHSLASGVRQHFQSLRKEEQRELSAPNHKSQIASDLKSRSPNRKNFPQIAAQAA